MILFSDPSRAGDIIGMCNEFGLLSSSVFFIGDRMATACELGCAIVTVRVLFSAPILWASSPSLFVAHVYMSPLGWGISIRPSDLLYL